MFVSTVKHLSPICNFLIMNCSKKLNDFIFLVSNEEDRQAYHPCEFQNTVVFYLMGLRLLLKSSGHLLLPVLLSQNFSIMSISTKKNITVFYNNKFSITSQSTTGINDHPWRSSDYRCTRKTLNINALE